MADLKFSVNSVANLESCVPELRILGHRALGVGLIDFAVIEGHRNKQRQNRLFEAGKSKVSFPFSKHNDLPSLAFDAAPVIEGKISWDPRHCTYLAGVMLTVAHELLGITVRWGGNWDQDIEPITDQDFQDLVHYEIVGGYL